jgi:hypothetical protein
MDTMYKGDSESNIEVLTPCILSTEQETENYSHKLSYPRQDGGPNPT